MLYENEKNIISEKNQKFICDNKDILQKASALRRDGIKNIDIIYEHYSKINMYLSEVKIMIITANEIERDTLFSYFSKNCRHYIVKIAKENLVYSFLRIGNNQIVHIEPASIGAYAHGGAAEAIEEAVKVVHPSIIVSVGVAFGANYIDNQIGDVLVGRQHFSYDKATKVSNGIMGIKRLHLEEPDEYMLSRFKSNISTEEKCFGVLGNKFDVLLGNMVTGEFVVDSIELRNMVFSPFKPFGIIGGEMEAYGIFEAVKSYKNIHCILMKGICDWGAGKNELLNTKREDKSEEETEEYNPKNDFQTLAMIDACQVCEQLLLQKEIFSDLKIKGALKFFWRTTLGKLIKYSVMKVKY